MYRPIGNVGHARYPEKNQQSIVSVRVDLSNNTAQTAHVKWSTLNDAIDTFSVTQHSTINR